MAKKAKKANRQPMIYSVRLWEDARDDKETLKEVVLAAHGSIIADMIFEGVGFYFRMDPPTAPYPLKQQVDASGGNVKVDEYEEDTAASAHIVQRCKFSDNNGTAGGEAGADTVENI